MISDGNISNFYLLIANYLVPIERMLKGMSEVIEVWNQAPYLSTKMKIENICKEKPLEIICIITHVVEMSMKLSNRKWSDDSKYHSFYKCICIMNLVLGLARGLPRGAILNGNRQYTNFARHPDAC